MRICKWLKPKEEVSLFDNGLRIESNLQILNSDKWHRRYVVCQRRCLSEAPLIGIFKNDSTRERGEHMELFYLQNYIGYEWGFKHKSSNKTLAILVQGQTLIFSFQCIDSMVFWKEWFKDVCGRSAMYFMRIYSAPKDPSIIRLSSRDARIHITRYALVIVQEIPPKQRLYLSLDDLFDVECTENRFAFRAMAYPWTSPQAFIFTSEQIPELSLKMRCLLKAKQYLNGAGQPSNGGGSRISSLKNGSGISVSDNNRPVPLSEWSVNNSTMQRQPQQQKRHHLAVSRSAEEEQTTPASPQHKLPRYENPSKFSYENTSGTLKQHYENSSNSSAENPTTKSVDNDALKISETTTDTHTNTEEGPYALPELTINEEEREHREDGNLSSSFGDFHMVPVQFMNPVTAGDQIVSFVGSPPGLIKPVSNDPPFLIKKKVRKALLVGLRKALDGSYTKYDGERSSNHDSYPLDETGQLNFSKPAVGTKFRQESGKKKSTSSRATTSTTKNSSNRVHAVVPIISMEHPKSMPSQEAHDKNKSFDSSVNSSVRIESAVQKGRERLKQFDRRSSTTSSRRSRSTVNSQSTSQHSSINDIRNEQTIPNQTELTLASELTTDHEIDASAEIRSTCNSMSTLKTAGEKEHSQADSSSVSNVTAYNQHTPLVISLEELRDPLFNISVNNLSISARMPSPAGSSGSSERSNSISVCSESRVIFQRGGRPRGSKKSNSKKNILPTPPSLPPPLPPPRKLSSQPCIQTNEFFHSPLATTQSLAFKINDDYADIDDLEFEMDTQQYPNDSNAAIMYTNLGKFEYFVPRANFMNTIDYVSIDDSATMALKNLSSHRNQPVLKRSNSMYDVVNFNGNRRSPTECHIRQNEKEYYTIVTSDIPSISSSRASHFPDYLPNAKSKSKKNKLSKNTTGTFSSSTQNLQ